MHREFVVLTWGVEIRLKRPDFLLLLFLLCVLSYEVAMREPLLHCSKTNCKNLLSDLRRSHSQFLFLTPLLPLWVAFSLESDSEIRKQRNNTIKIMDEWMSGWMDGWIFTQWSVSGIGVCSEDKYWLLHYFQMMYNLNCSVTWRLS